MLRFAPSRPGGGMESGDNAPPRDPARAGRVLAGTPSAGRRRSQGIRDDEDDGRPCRKGRELMY